MTDTALIAACAAFADLEAEITAYERAYFAEMHALEGKPQRRKPPRNADHALADKLVEPIVHRAWAENRGIHPPPHPCAAELETVLNQVCDLEASSLAGLAARARAMLRHQPNAIDEFEVDWRDARWARMRNAQVRDLHAILHVDLCAEKRKGKEPPAEALARGAELARSLAQRVVN